MCTWQWCCHTGSILTGLLRSKKKLSQWLDMPLSHLTTPSIATSSYVCPLMPLLWKVDRLQIIVPAYLAHSEHQLGKDKSLGAAAAPFLLVLEWERGWHYSNAFPFCSRFVARESKLPVELQAEKGSRQMGGGCPHQGCYSLSTF